MKFRDLGKFALMAGVLAFAVVFLITGPYINSLKKEYRERGFFESLGAEFTGRAVVDRDYVNNVAGFNRILLGGGIILCIVGGSAMIVGPKKTAMAG